MNTGTAYTTTDVEQSQVIYSHLPKASKLSLDCLYEDIRRVYPIDKPRFISFNYATWIVASDGIATVQLELPRTEGPREVVTLNGTWETRNGVTQLHMAGTGLYGFKIAMDGLLHPNDDGLRMDGVFIATVRGAHHVERVALHLAQVSNPTPNEWAVASIEGFRQGRAQESLRREGHPLSEPTAWVGGVPVPTNYDAKLKVKLDGAELAPMAGHLSLTRVEGLTEPTIGLTISTDGPVVRGWNGWIIGSELVKHPQSGVAVTASNGRILVDISTATSFNNNWYILKSDHPNELVPVIADEGTIDIQVNGDNFTGTISSKGRVQEGKHPDSTFSATLSGKRQGSDFVKGIANFIGARPFDGQWRDARLGEMILRQHESKVSGEFSDGCVIEGTVRGPVLDLSWKSSASKHGRGFLSAATDGMLVGMFWVGDQSFSFEPIVAIQSLPTARLNGQSPHVPTPTNDAQAQELKYLGYDLCSVGKYREAAEILDMVVTYYADCSRKSENDPAAYSNYLLNQALPLKTLIANAYEVGDYPVLVKSLSTVVRIQRELGKDAAGPRNFCEQAGKYIAEVEKGAETMNKLAAAFDKELTMLYASGIGIHFEEEKNTSGIKITEVSSDMPACRAGVVPGDVLLGIDGVPVANVSEEQVINCLRGKDGSTVTITLSRSGHPIDIEMVRVPLIKLDAERREELVKAITKLRALAVRTSQNCRADVADLKSFAKAMSQRSTEKLDVLTAFAALTGHIERLLTKHEKDRPEMIALARQSLANSPRAFGLFERFVALQDEVFKNLDAEGMERMQKLDLDENEFEKSLDVSEQDKEMLRLSILMLGVLNSMNAEASGRLRVIKTVAKFSSQASSSDQIAKHLARLAVWLDNWRSKMVTDAAKIASLEYGQDFYANYVRTLADLNLSEQALVASEAARARAFQDLLAGRTVDYLADPANSSAKAPFPNPKAVSPITLDEILAIVKERKSTVIEYMTTEKELFIWIITPKGTINMIRHPLNRDVLKQSINEFVELVEPKRRSQKEQNERVHRLNQILIDLHAQLVEPIPTDLLPNNPMEPLTIVPYGELFRVPYNILTDNNGDYFISKHALVFSAAVSILRYTHENKAKSTHLDNTKLLAVVNPKPLPKSNFSQLDETEHAFQQLLKFYTGTIKDDVLVGSDATKANLRICLKSGEHAVVYFGTHGDIDDNDVFNSYIALAKLDGKGQTEDGRLRISDIFGLNLRSDLSILAACGTGRGGVSADGVNGLSRAFVRAGSASLLTSLWTIPEMMSFKQVCEFHQYWRAEGMTKANALRMTQLNDMVCYPDQPEIWAGFQLYGEGE